MIEKKPAKIPGSDNVKAFLKKVASTPVVSDNRSPGRLIFSLDATASRRSTWDTACQLQGTMFQETAALGGIHIQLAYFRGFGEFKASDWTANSKLLLKQMTEVTCLAGETQIEKLLRHTINQTQKIPVDALVYVGDSVEEDIDRLGTYAGQLGLLGVPVFIFQEGFDELAEFAFKQITKLTGGAFCRLDQFSSKNLAELLRAVAVFAAGGKKALDLLAKEKGGSILKIAHQIKKD